MYKQLEPVKLHTKYCQIFITVAVYWIVSIITVFVNKALLSSNEINLNAPLFITWFQCIISTLICLIMSQLTKYFPVLMFPPGSPLRKDVFKKIIPLAILFTSMIAFNNLCLKYVGVAFYYVGRSLTTVFNVALAFLFLKQTTSWKCILCCVFIIFGFWLGVDQESLTETFSLRGTLFGILASLSLSLYSIYTKKVLPFVDQQIWLLSYYNNFYSCFLFLPLIIIRGELTDIFNHKHDYNAWFWLMMTIGGFFGFLIGLVTALQIKVTSPLTHNISGTAKACAQTVIATQWYQESKPILWWASNLIVLVGSAFYTRIKQLEMSEDHKKISSLQKI